MATVENTAQSQGPVAGPQFLEDHRVRVANLRRERMRMRLIESALHVFASKGIDATDIKDVIEHAGVSRGSFYNYFQTNEELMSSVLQVLGNELLQVVDEVVLSRSDPAERVACGIRLVLHAARKHLLLARFTVRVGMQQLVDNSLAMQYLPRDLAAGVETEQFKVASPVAALTMVLGATHAAICAMSLNSNLPSDFPESMAFQILVGLGLSSAQVAHLVALPMDEIRFPPDALLARTLGATASL